MDYVGMYAGYINKITSVKMTDKHFNYETMERGANIWVTELCLDKIKVSRRLKGTRGKLFKDEVKVQTEEMMEIFDQIYDFVRNAEYADILIDDTEHEIVITYNDFHRETIINNLYKDDEDLIGMIEAFVESKDITSFSECMENKYKK